MLGAKKDEPVRMAVPLTPVSCVHARAWTCNCRHVRCRCQTIGPQKEGAQSWNAPRPFFGSSPWWRSDVSPELGPQWQRHPRYRVCTFSFANGLVAQAWGKVTAAVQTKRGNINALHTKVRRVLCDRFARAIDKATWQAFTVWINHALRARNISINDCTKVRGEARLASRRVSARFS